MKIKNPFWYTAFLDQSGFAEVSGEELLRDFYQEWAIALMDYIDPRSGFTGRVTAKVKSTSELQGAIEAFQFFREYVAFPPEYEKNLRAAADRGQDPNDYQIELEVES